MASAADHRANAVPPAEGDGEGERLFGRLEVDVCLSSLPRFSSGKGCDLVGSGWLATSLTMIRATRTAIARMAMTISRKCHCAIEARSA